MRSDELNSKLATRQAGRQESRRTAHQRAGKSSKLGIRQTQKGQRLTAPRAQANTGQAGRPKTEGLSTAKQRKTDG